MSKAEQQSVGVYHTPREIHQQPRMWRETLRLIERQSAELSAFLDKAGIRRGESVTVYLLGAGTSEYVGNAVADTLRRQLGVSCTSLPTTTFLPSPNDWLLENGRYLFVHFARSGDSPESVASYRTARLLAPESYHLVITCNRDGGLAKEPVMDGHVHVLVLPDETNDQSLVMTSSYSSMSLAAMAIANLANLEEFGHNVEAAASAAERLLENQVEPIRAFTNQSGARLQYLGTGNLYGTMEESRLKVLEMTAGKIAANVNTYLGLRHGPQVFINRECGVVASLSSEPYRRRYEIDLLAELRDKEQGSGMLIICDRRDASVDALRGEVIELVAGGSGVPDELRVVTDVVVGQLIGLFKSIALSLKPDNPSESGIINRVVSGVHIYPLDDASVQA